MSHFKLKFMHLASIIPTPHLVVALDFKRRTCLIVPWAFNSIKVLWKLYNTYCVLLPITMKFYLSSNFLSCLFYFGSNVQVVLDLDETLVSAYEASSVPIVVRSQAIEAGVKCFELECISMDKVVGF